MVVDAAAARKHWLFGLWSAASFTAGDDSADGFSYTRWPELNSRSLVTRVVTVKRIEEGKD